MKTIHVVGGGTVAHASCHLGLCAPAFGSTARKLAALCRERLHTMDTQLTLTAMASGNHAMQSPHDLDAFAKRITESPDTKIVFWSPAICDFTLDVGLDGKYGGRLDSSQEYAATLRPVRDKTIAKIRNGGWGGPARKDITLVGFKTTCGADEDAQYLAGLNLLKAAGCNLVLANDTKHRRNMVIVPEEARYCVTTDRTEALTELVAMAGLRSHLTFTRSTVVAGTPVPWTDAPDALRQVVDHCVSRGAYRKFRGATAGHFAVQLSPTQFLSSRRKTDLGDIANVGLVLVETDGPDTVIAYGSKPSVGGQSQRIVFAEHPQYNSIVHFHCPIRPGSEVPVVSQREYECGSHECGRNTSQGLKQFGRLKAVYLDNHGPNVLFNHRDYGIAKEVIQFIEANFDLDQKTGGAVS